MVKSSVYIDREEVTNCPECQSKDTYIRLHKMNAPNVYPMKCKRCGNEWTLEERANETFKYA